MPEANSVGVNLLGGQAMEEVLVQAFEAVGQLESRWSNLTPANFDKLTQKTLTY